MLVMLALNKMQAEKNRVIKEEHSKRARKRKVDNDFDYDYSPHSRKKCPTAAASSDVARMKPAPDSHSKVRRWIDFHNLSGSQSCAAAAASTHRVDSTHYHAGNLATVSGTNIHNCTLYSNCYDYYFHFHVRCFNLQ